MTIAFKILTNIEGWHDLYRTPSAPAAVTQYAWDAEATPKHGEALAVEVLVREKGTLAGRDGIIALVGLGHDREALGRLARALSDAHGPEMRQAASTLDEARSRQLLEPVKKTCLALQLAQMSDTNYEDVKSNRQAPPSGTLVQSSRQQSGGAALTVAVVALLGAAGLIGQQIWKAPVQPQPLRFTVSDEDIKKIISVGTSAWEEAHPQAVSGRSTEAGTYQHDHDSQELSEFSKSVRSLADIVTDLARMVQEMRSAAPPPAGSSLQPQMPSRTRSAILPGS